VYVWHMLANMFMCILYGWDPADAAACLEPTFRLVGVGRQ
jgi:hypothetical protein